MTSSPLKSFRPRLWAPLLGGLALTTLAAGAARAETWQLDPAHSAASFSVRHLMVSQVRGQFEKMSGTVELDEANLPKSRVEVSIEAASIDTGNEKRDEHLRSADFFDVANHPDISFKSTRIKPAGKGKYLVTGDLTMRGVTKSVTLTVNGPSNPLKTPFGHLVRGLTASGKLNRKDWGLNWNKAIEAGGVAVGDEVTLQIDVELVPKSPPTAASK